MRPGHLQTSPNMQSYLSKVVLRLASTISQGSSCVSLITKRYKHTPSIKFTHGKLNREGTSSLQHNLKTAFVCWFTLIVCCCRLNYINCLINHSFTQNILCVNNAKQVQLTNPNINLLRHLLLLLVCICLTHALHSHVFALLTLLSVPRSESSGNYSRFKRRALTEEEIRTINVLYRQCFANCLAWRCLLTHVLSILTKDVNRKWL